MSVLDQTFKNLELIFVDDGSTDCTLAIAEALARNDCRLKIVVQENAGRPSIARNRGLVEAKGEYLAFLDSDDFWLPNRVEKMVAGLDQHPEWGAVFHDLKLVSESGTDLGEIYLAEAAFLSKAAPWLTAHHAGWFDCNQRFFVFMSLYYAAVHTQSIMIARSRLPDADLSFDPQFVICEDTDLWIRLAMSGRLGYLNEVLSAYRQIGTSITRDRLRFAAQSVNFHQHNRHRLKELLSPDERRCYERKLANYFRNLGFIYYDLYHLSAARGAYRQAFCLDAQLKDVFALGKTLLPRQALEFLRKKV